MIEIKETRKGNCTSCGAFGREAVWLRQLRFSKDNRDYTSVFLCPDCYKNLMLKMAELEWEMGINECR